MVELVDTLVLEASGEIRVSSSLTIRTRRFFRPVFRWPFLCRLLFFPELAYVVDAGPLLQFSPRSPVLLLRTV